MRAPFVLSFVFAGLVLAGCGNTVPASNPGAKSEGPLAGLFAGSEGAKPASSPKRPQMPLPLAKASLAGGDVVVAGPEGYCLDPKTIQSRPGRGFALIASCRILSGGAVGAWAEPVLITVTVGPKGAEDDLPGPAAIAQAAGAALLGGESSDGFVAANLDRGGDALMQGGDQRYWRGAFVLNGRLVGLALYAPKDSTYATQQGGTMLASVRAKIVSLSAQRRLSAANPSPAGGKKEKGLFGRLFNGKDLP